MDLFPVELLEKIFGFLPHRDIQRCGLVCRKWLAIVRQPRFFSRFSFGGSDRNWTSKMEVFSNADVFPFNTIKIVNHKIMDKRLKEFSSIDQSSKASIHSLKLTLTKSSSNVKSLTSFINEFSHIKHLSICLADVDVNWNGFNDLRTLESVQVLEIEVKKKHVILDLDNILGRIISKLPNLKKLTLEICDRALFEDFPRSLAIRCFQRISESVPVLELLVSKDTSKLPWFYVDFSISQLLRAVNRPNISIRRFLMNINTHEKSESLELIKEMSQSHHWKNLTTLTIDVAEYEDSFNLLRAEIPKGFPRLKKLEVNAWVLKDSSLLECLERFPDLESFKVEISRNVFASHVRVISLEVSQLPKLRDLTIIQREEFQLRLSSFHLAVNSLRTLTRLEIEGFQITKESMNFISECLIDLTFLDLSNCELLHDDDFRYLRNLQNLEHLSLGRGLSITDMCLVTHFEFRRLRVLQLIKFSNVGDAGMESLARKNPFIEELKLKSVALTDVGVQNICKSMSYLKYMSITGCTNVTTAVRGAIEAKNLRNVMIYLNDGRQRICY